MSHNRNTVSKSRPIGTNQSGVNYDHESTDALGRESIIVRDEAPTRVDEVSDSLIYLGWAEFGADEDVAVWKIKRIQQIGAIWELKFVNGEELYHHRWDQRVVLPYL